MEFGCHCDFDSCKRLDFLPFTCEQCNLTFCSDHKSSESHNCLSSVDQTTTTLPAKREGDGEGEIHYCSIEKCGRIKTGLQVTCTYCHKMVCLRHREQSEHDCISTVSSSGNRTVDLQTTKTTKVTHRRPQGPSSASLSNKVAFMKLKMKAQSLGSVPELERIYLSILFPQEYDGVSHPVYLSKKWTVGKAIDSIATKYKLRNNNDKPGSKRLVLLVNECDVLPMDQQLNAVSNSGDTLTLEYI